MLGTMAYKECSKRHYSEQQRAGKMYQLCSVHAFPTGHYFYVTPYFNFV